MSNLKKLLQLLHEDVNASSSEDIVEACKLIIEVQELDSAERDCISKAYYNGPLFDGDIPSKNARDKLIKKGFMSKIIVSKQEGYNACTYKGGMAYRLMTEIRNDSIC